MPGPQTASEALKWASAAFRAGRYWPVDHFEERCEQRGITIRDVQKILQTAFACKRYAGRARAGGTTWRIRGHSLDGIETALGVEIAVDHLGQIMFLITTF